MADAAPCDGGRNAAVLPARAAAAARSAALPASLQAWLRARASDIEVRRHCGYTPRARALATPVIWFIRLFYALEARLRQLGRLVPGRRARHWIGLTARWARGGGRALGLGYERLAYRVSHGLRPAERWPGDGVADLDARVWADPERVLADAAAIRFVPGTEAFAHDAARNRWVVTLAGCDFLRSGSDMVFLEVNLDPALRPARAAIYEGDDPMWVRLVDFCRAHGLRRIVVYGYRPFSPTHRETLARQAAPAGIQVRVIDDLLAAGPHARERAYFMDDAGADSLIVRAKYFRTHFDAAVKDKRLSQQVVEWYNARVAPAARVRIPRLLSAAEVAARYDAQSRFPTVAVKEAFADRGHGIHFFKGPSVPPLGVPRDLLVQEFVEPDTADRRVVRGREEIVSVPGARHVRIFRMHGLLTHAGPVYLSGHTVTSFEPLPDAPLADGFVRDASRFMANFSAGAGYGQLGATEDAWCRAACEGALAAFQAWVQVKYQTA
jgi:hypothetical protein